MTTPDEPTARGNVVAIGRITTVGPDGDCVCERAMLVEFKDTGSAIAATQSGHVSFTVFGAEVGESPAPDDTAKLLSASIELERLRKANALMLEALRKVRDALQDRADVVDGPYGEQRPNEAMQLLSELGDEIDAAIAAATAGAQEGKS